MPSLIIVILSTQGIMGGGIKNLHSTSSMILFDTEGGIPFLIIETRRKYMKLIFNSIIFDVS